MSGPLWLGIGLGWPGVALYVNARAQPPGEQWARVAECVRLTLPTNDANALLAGMSSHATPVCVGVEGTSSNDAQLKVYWRLRKPISLKELPCELLISPCLAQFLNFVVGQKSLPISGLVFSAGFNLADGHLQGAKIDLCGHCTKFTRQEWLNVIEHLTRSNKLVDLDLGAVLQDGIAEVAFIGFGLNALGEGRLNLYLKGAN